jgi:hypothetical protein
MTELIMASYSRPERLPIIRGQLAVQTDANFNFTVWDNTKENLGSSVRFKVAKIVRGNPIIFIDDDESLEPDFVEYMVRKYREYPDAVQGWFTRIFPGEVYWGSIPYNAEGTEVDYVGTGGMVLDRKIFDEEPILQNIPPEYDKVEDLFLSYLARKRGQKLLALAPHIKIVVDGKDQYKALGDYKETAFLKLRENQWTLLRERKK